MSNYVISPVERAAYAFLKSKALAWLPWQQIYRGLDNEEAEGWFNRPRNVRKYPAVVFICESADPVLPATFAGAWKPKLEVQVWSNRYSDTDLTHEARCRDVIDLFITTSITADLIAAYAADANTRTANAGEQLFIRKVIPSQQGTRFEGKGWCSFQAFDLEEVGHLNVDQLSH